MVRWIYNGLWLFNGFIMVLIMVILVNYAMSHSGYRSMIVVVIVIVYNGFTKVL